MNSALLSPQRLITVLAARLRHVISGGQRPGPMPHTRRRLNFLIIRLDQIGDTILTTPLFRELRHSFPGSHCTAIVRSAAAPLLETNPYVDVVLTMPIVQTRWLPEWARKFLAACILYKQQLQGSNYDIAIMPRWDMDLDLATLVMILANARTTVGYTEKCSPLKMQWNAGFDRAFSVCVEPGPLQHEVMRTLDLLPAIGGGISRRNLQLTLLESDRAWARSMVTAAAPITASSPGETLIAIGFATSNGPSREWPLENYAEVLRMLNQKHPARAVLLSLPGEKVQADRLASLLIPKPLVIVGTGLRNFAAVLERCDLFIGNDSGLAHLAAAVNLPLVVVSPHPLDGDPTHLNSPIRFGPLAEAVRILRPQHGSDDCVTHCSRQRHAHCICAVTPASVFEAALDLLLAPQSTSLDGTAIPSYTNLITLPVSHSAEANAVSSFADLAALRSSRIESPSAYKA